MSVWGKKFWLLMNGLDFAINAYTYFGSGKVSGAVCMALNLFVIISLLYSDKLSDLIDHLRGRK